MRRIVGVLAIVSACVAGAGSVAFSASETFIVKSSLDGKTTLPLRLHWLAYPHGNATPVSEVQFLIDGKLRWTEQQAPYNYGSDDNGRNAGYLITTWLAPGKHKFTARALDQEGNEATTTVVATVAAAPAPPAALAGTWARTVTPADLQKSGPSGPPSGPWHLVFDRVGAWHLDPMGSGLVNQYDVHGGTINVYAPIQMAPFSDGKGGINKFGHHGIGGSDCTDAGPFGSYTWSVSEDALTLTAKREPCGNRRAIWEGVWTRSK